LKAEVSIVCAVHARMMPYSFEGVELRGIAGKVVGDEVPLVVREPLADIGISMVGRIVLDKMNFPGKIGPQYSFEVSDIGLRIEDGLELIEESGAIQLDRSEYFERVSLPGRGYQWLRTDPGPCLVKCGVLPEACFVFVEEDRPLGFGFFLMRG